MLRLGGEPGLLALAPGAISERVRAVPALAFGARLHGAMRGALRRGLGGVSPVGLEPLAGIFDLAPDAGEVHPAQGHQDFMAVQGGFERDAHRCLWQGRRGSFCLRLCGCLSLAVGASAALLLHQRLSPLIQARSNAMFAPPAQSFGGSPCTRRCHCRPHTAWRR